MLKTWLTSLRVDHNLSLPHLLLHPSIAHWHRLLLILLINSPGQMESWVDLATMVRGRDSNSWHPLRGHKWTIIGLQLKMRQYLHAFRDSINDSKHRSHAHWINTLRNLIEAIKLKNKLTMSQWVKINRQAVWRFRIPAAPTTSRKGMTARNPRRDTLWQLIHTEKDMKPHSQMIEDSLSGRRPSSEVTSEKIRPEI